MIKEAKETIDKLIKAKPKTFENTIKVLAKLESDISRKSTSIVFYKNVSTLAE